MKRTWSKRARAGSLLMAFLMGFTALNLIPAGRGGAAQPVSAAEVPALKTVYDFPAKDWESEALPLGNGFLGAMVFGALGATASRSTSIRSGRAGRARLQVMTAA